MRDWACKEKCTTDKDSSHFFIILSLMVVSFAVAQCKYRIIASQKTEDLPLTTTKELLDQRIFKKVKREVQGNLLKSSAISLVIAAKEAKVRQEKLKKQIDDSSTELQDLLFGTIMNSTMMVWSVLFHSWLGFVMLMMANVMWIIPRQSVFMKRMVRFVSTYTCIRVSVTYLASFTYDFPESIMGIHLKQFGLKYETEMEKLALFMQFLFTAICLITYRQYTKPYIAGLNIPLSGFKRWVKVISLMWVRYALLAIVVMVLYDVQTFKIVVVPFYVSIAIAMWIPRQPGVPLTIFFSLLVVVAEIKLILTYVYNFAGASKYIGEILDLSDVKIYFAFGLRKMQGGALLLHLWLPNILAMFSAIFLTALKRETIDNLQRNSELWDESMKELLLVSSIKRRPDNDEESKSLGKRRAALSTVDNELDEKIKYVLFENHIKLTLLPIRSLSKVGKPPGQLV
ncbi:piezo-type mechanosensitive ion channel component-like [Neocloeon triangulifer]|uniref:piezo-type mechanosensitive ion channel component-like n=1 Tax=Neocloeon triangulifer TaxID=2078957 RepID=UPI00286F6CDB|nr:piezo-type mechanosensitive ion channel component-like [Neocloeon triangulifer]